MLAAPSWRVAYTGFADGAMNMAIDEAVMIAHQRGLAPPTLRFYRWRPLCLSIGYAQSMRRDVELAECRRQGIDAIRRPTGGRAVLHDQEVTYSLVCNENHPKVSGGIVESYRKISAGILAGLQRLGVDVAATAARLPSGQSKTAACFDSASHYEITTNGRKIVGSAQVRKTGVILQHGSVLLEINPMGLFALLRVPSEEERVRLTNELAGQVIGLSEALGRPASFDEVARSIQDGFQEAFGVEFRPGELTLEETATALSLKRDKYSTEAWNFLR